MSTTSDLYFLDTRVRIPVSCRDGDDALSLIECWAPEGHSPPLHVHRTEDELFRVLEGEFRFVVGNDDVRLHAGEALLAPKGVAHQFRVESPEGGRWLVATNGGDFERFVREFSREDGPAPFDPDALVEACRRHEIDVIGPPLA